MAGHRDFGRETISLGKDSLASPANNRYRPGAACQTAGEYSPSNQDRIQIRALGWKKDLFAADGKTTGNKT